MINFVGTPIIAELAAASADKNHQFFHYLVDPRQAEGKPIVVHDPCLM